MHLVDLKTGELVFYETNEETSSVGSAFRKFAKEHPDREFAFIHNHNIVSSLSETDLMTPITTSNIPMIFAVQNDGVIYYAKKIKDAPKGFWPDEYFKQELKELNNDSRNGIITPAQRSIQREEIVINGLLQEFYDGMEVINGKRK